MFDSSYRRRDILTGAARAVPLIGTALAAGPYQAERVGALKGSAKSVVIPTHEFAGDIDERLAFPVQVGDQLHGHERP